ncbi:MAG: heavy metal translocating P-type ATPase metal-binding domain-containing protein [Flavobacteriales bacterium]|nr:heavy metal translocating P-type ATPase metal-binding domain-containing protein [Flavobacteriales bacterium]MCB9198285.1 heavy metal translocating P-type ATPase metal-binding domain-containing protein [Flavobacteriales bacterium]
MENQCAHCGESCRDSKITIDENHFCCEGCKTVYQILQTNDLCHYYANGETPGNTIRNVAYYDKFDILDDTETKRSFVLFSDQNQQKITFHIPFIHCSSCIWLLENLNKLNENIIASEVNFQKKEILITAKTAISLKEIAILLSSIGYEPSLSISEKNKAKTNHSLLIKIGVAGFCFGNIMLYAFPEYLGLEDKEFSTFFSWLSFGLSLPLIFYAGSDYLKSALDSIQQKFVNMDIPIAVGILTIFGRSTYELITQTGSGYFDSLSGLIFFLLIGKWFQQKTYDTLSFERTYKSYFPLSVNVKGSEGRFHKKLEDLSIGDIIYIRNEEIIPADGLLMSQNATIDYGFVTGESDSVFSSEHEIIYAGGKNKGTEIEIRLTKKANSSYLTQLWNKEEEDHKESVNTIADKVSKYFTYAVLIITVATALFWIIFDQSKIWTSVTAVLIVACPCALALTIPFTLGNSIRYLGRKGIYLKNTYIIEKLAKINAVAFDKTGTLTKLNHKKLEYTSLNGQELNQYASVIRSITKNSAHPMSKAIAEFLSSYPEYEVKNYIEVAGLGVSADFSENHYHIGKIKDKNEGSVGLYVNQKLVGFFTILPEFREEIESVNRDLNYDKIEQHLISGDSEREDQAISEILHFDSKQYKVSPQDKKDIIKNIQKKNKNVLMIGDGLNDAGALLQANVGIAVSDDVNYFVPACDVIIDGKSIKYLSKLLRFSQLNMRIIKHGFILSFIYNIIGLSFAVSGTLSPIIAAILMPLSSITIVAFTSLSSRYNYNRLFK